jgi:hypothetical protein
MCRDILEPEVGDDHGSWDPLVVDARIPRQVPQRRAVEAQDLHVEAATSKMARERHRAVHLEVVELARAVLQLILIWRSRRRAVCPLDLLRLRRRAVTPDGPHVDGSRG